MPELPEVETIARTLAASILGARVGSVWTSGLPLRLARPLDVGALRRAAAGRTLAAVRRKGKYLLLDFEGGPRSARGPAGARAGVLVHLGMSGRLLVDPAATTRPPHTHVVFTLDGGRELRFRDPRRFGWLTAGTPIDAVDELALLGPDPLTELDETELATRLDGVRAAWETSTSPRRCFAREFTRRRPPAACVGVPASCFAASVRRWRWASRTAGPPCATSSIPTVRAVTTPQRCWSMAARASLAGCAGR